MSQSDDSIDYNLVPSVSAFVASDKFQSFIVGPVGSTKTSASLMKILYEARRIAPCKDGIRRSRFAVIRNTRQQLFDTTIPDFLKWFPEGKAGTMLKTDAKFLLKMGSVEAEVLFRGLDDTNDVRRLLSLQLTGAMLDETREISKDVYNALTGRVGRYPDKAMVPHRPEWGKDEKGFPIAGCVDDAGKSMKKVWGATNPPDAETFWYHYLVDPPENAHVTIQPSGLSPEADWLHLLPASYYEDMIQGKSEEWVDVYVHGKWGRSLAGKPVFTAFRQDFHVAKSALKPLRTAERPVIIGMDFGLNPSAVLMQVDMFGRLLVFDALTSDNMGVLRFIQTRLKPLLASKYAGLTVLVVGDPAGAQRAQTDEKSCFDILKAENFRVVPAKTNAPVARVAAVDAFLLRQIEGGAGVLIDPEARVLISALRSEYRYKRKKSGEYEDSPEKNAASHVADAFQYGCLHADGGLRGGFVGTQRREIVNFNTLGWT